MCVEAYCCDLRWAIVANDVVCVAHNVMCVSVDVLLSRPQQNYDKFIF